MLFVTAPIAGALVNRVGEQLLIIGGLLLQTAGMAWIGLIATPGHAYPEFIAPLIISGCGVAIAFPPAQNVVVSSVAAGDIGKASGTFTMIRQLGGAFGVAILATVFAAVGNFNSAQAFGNGFALAMEVFAAMSLLGAIASLVLPGMRSKKSEAVKPSRPEKKDMEHSPADSYQISQHTKLI